MARKKQRKSKAARSGQPNNRDAPPNPPIGNTSKARGSRRNAQPDPWRRRLLGGGALLAVGIPAGFLIHRHDVQARETHDLSAIGSGVPVVVQVDDPSCSQRRQLKGSTERALEDLPHVQYRIADLTTDKGREFGAEHNAGKVTLLLFDRRGRLRDRVQGVTPADALTERFKQAFRAPS